jgi:hypothetical protein
MNKQIIVGTDVICNGFRGTVIEVCGGKLTGMIVVRLDRGETCVGSNSVAII